MKPRISEGWTRITSRRRGRPSDQQATRKTDQAINKRLGKPTALKWKIHEGDIVSALIESASF